MIETSAKFILIFVVACCWSCSTRQNESNQRSNNTSLQSRDTLNEGYQPLMNPYYLEDADASPQQKSFNDLFINFNKFSESSERIVYEVSYDLGGAKTACHFKEGELKYYTFQTSEEGGYFVVELIHVSLENRRAARVTSESDGFFKWINPDTTIWYSVVMDQRPRYVVKQPLTKTPDFLESTPDSLILKVIKNKDKFKLAKGQYEWFLRREKKMGYFGKEIEEYEVIRVDPKLFESDFGSLSSKRKDDN